MRSPARITNRKCAALTLAVGFFCFCLLLAEGIGNRALWNRKNRQNLHANDSGYATQSPAILMDCRSRSKSLKNALDCLINGQIPLDVSPDESDHCEDPKRG